MQDENTLKNNDNKSERKVKNSKNIMITQFHLSILPIKKTK